MRGALLQWWVWVLVLGLILSMVPKQPKQVTEKPIIEPTSISTWEYTSYRQQVKDLGFLKIKEGDQSSLSGYRQLQREVSYDETIAVFVNQHGVLPDYIKVTEAPAPGLVETVLLPLSILVEEKEHPRPDFYVTLVYIAQDRVYRFAQNTETWLQAKGPIPDEAIDYFIPEDRTKLLELRQKKEEK